MNFSKKLILLLCCVLMLPACTATKQVAQTTPVNYYPACYQPISSLRDADNSTTKSAVVGGIGGALLGGLVGGLATGRASGALIGAGVGAVTGASLGYAKAKQDKISDARARYASYVGDIRNEVGSLDATTLAARAAQACYEKSFNELVAQYKAKAITPEEYKRRFNEIREGLRETAAYLGQSYAKASEKEQQFQEALVSEAKVAGVAVPPAKQRKTVAAAPPAKPAAAKKKAAPQAQPEPVVTESSAAGQNATQAERTQYLAGLDENSLDSVSASTTEYTAAKEDTKVQQVAVEQLLLKMDSVDASMSAI